MNECETCLAIYVANGSALLTKCVMDFQKELIELTGITVSAIL